MAERGIYLVLFIAVIAILDPCTGAKVLCLGHQFPPHLLMVHSVGEGLLKQGHEVYTVLSDKMAEPTGLRETGLKIIKYHTPDDHHILSSPEMTDKIKDWINYGGSKSHLLRTSEVALGECQDMDGDEVLYQELHSLKFDIALINMLPISRCLMFMALKLEIPFVIIQADIDMDLMRTPALPSFTPHRALALSEDMTFYQRIKNTYVTVISSIEAFSPFQSIKNVELLEKYRTDPQTQTWKDLARKAELFLVTRGHMLEYALPLTPNVISIECHTCKPANALSPEIEQMIKEYEKVILISFGSQIEQLPYFVIGKFLTAFIEIRDVLFLWHFKGTLPTDTIPNNVKIIDSLPLNDLLAHPKTKLLITHAGNNVQYESVYHGVPMLAFPVFAGQPHNAVRMVVNGYGLKAEIRSFTSEELVEKTKELLNNPTYRRKSQKAGRILKEAPMNAIDTAVFWVEHVLEFGSNHLRSHGLKMPWYSYYMIDILLLIEVTFLTFMAVLVIAFRKIARLYKERQVQKGKRD